MALFRGDIRSEILQMDTSVTVILPYDRPLKNQPNPCKVLYLYHGIKLNSTGWNRWSSIETYAKDTGIAVIIPEGYRSFYTDMQHGGDYFQFFSKELPALCSAMFGISTKRQDNFAAGLSMGGYGALKLGLRCPQQFAAVAGLSPVCNPIQFATGGLGGPICQREAPAIWGNPPVLQPQDDLHALVLEAAKLPKGQCPRLYISCGTEDALHPSALQLKAEIEAQNLDLTFEQWPGGHDWEFWNLAVKKAIDFFLT